MGGAIQGRGGTGEARKKRRALRGGVEIYYFAHIILFSYSDDLKGLNYPRPFSLYPESRHVLLLVLSLSQDKGGRKKAEGHFHH
jgi:hypothetical protein